MVGEMGKKRGQRVQVEGDRLVKEVVPHEPSPYGQLP